MNDIYKESDLIFYQTGRFNISMSKFIDAECKIKRFNEKGNITLKCGVCRKYTYFYDELTKRPVCCLDCLEKVRENLTKGRPPQPKKKKRGRKKKKK